MVQNRRLRIASRIAPLLLVAFASGMAEARTASVSLLVPADAGWIDTGLDIAIGETVDLSAAGLWADGNSFVGPNGYAKVVASTTLVPGLPFASLVGRIGSSTFFVGTGSKQMGEGRLFLAMNDTPDGYLDNSGYQAVVVKISKTED